MENITIILSTYNGEKYLNEQIDSILAQTDTNWTLLIRDDGSKDKTIELIQYYTEKYPEKIEQIPSNENLGVIRSYELLLKQCQTQYIMLCDQDDVWLPKKIEWTREKMTELEKENQGKPLVVYTDLQIVDEKLNPIFSSFWNYSKIMPSLLTTFDMVCAHSAATGCTMMINQEALRCSLPFCDEVRMHDSWILLNSLKAGGAVSYVNEPTILYRQHTNNVIGAINEKDFYLKNKLKSLKSVLKSNLAQWKMINKLGFKSPFKYIILKFQYHIKYAKVGAYNTSNIIQH